MDDLWVPPFQDTSRYLQQSLPGDSQGRSPLHFARDGLGARVLLEAKAMVDEGSHWWKFNEVRKSRWKNSQIPFKSLSRLNKRSIQDIKIYIKGQ